MKNHLSESRDHFVSLFRHIGHLVTRVVILAGLLTLVWLPFVYAGQATTLTYSSTMFAESAGPEYMRQIGEFFKVNPDIKIEPDPSPYGQFATKMAVRFKGGEPSDIVMAEIDWIHAWVAQGWLRDLTPLVTNTGGKAFLDNYFPMLINQATKDGKLYGLPRHAGGYHLYYNADLFREAGLDPAKPPRTWDELLDYARKLTKKDAVGNTVQWGIAIHGMNVPSVVSRFVNWMYVNGADVLSPDNKRGLLDQPKAVETLRFWSELYTKEKVVPPGAVQVGPAQGRTLFAQKRVVILQGILWGVSQTLAENPAWSSSLLVAPFPKQMPNAPSNFQVVYDTISTQSKNSEAAWELLQWFARPENQIALYKASRYAPSRRDVFVRPEIQNDPAARVLAVVNENLKPEPAIPQWEQINRIIGDAMQEALNQAKTPEVAMRDADARVNKVLAQ
jgi:ABC-type glycerol-3-phosphate transport system substrate-binding protein